MEFKLLSHLYSRKGAIVPKHEVYQHMWPGRSADKCVAALDKLLSRVRAKIEPNPARPRYLLTVRGRGYRLNTD
jgi:DNA-binding response OmpR family regulator